MTAVSAKFNSTNKDGKRVVDAFIVADTTPAELPTNGKDIVGMDEDDVFAPFSVLYVVDASAATKYYLADESGIFQAQ